MENKYPLNNINSKTIIRFLSEEKMSSPPDCTPSLSLAIYVFTNVALLYYLYGIDVQYLSMPNEKFQKSEFADYKRSIITAENAL